MSLWVLLWICQRILIICNMIKIILCTTFRDFLGTDNDNIQYRFLDSIKKQKYQNYTVVTTTFGEKNVKKVVDDNLGSHSVVIDVKLDKYRFSLTDVVLNAITVSEKESDDCIIFWTCCDNILEENFFEILSNRYSKMFAGAIHPNKIFLNNEDASKGVNGRFDYFYCGVDSLFFDAKLLQAAKEDLEKYRFYEWGVFEYFLMAVIVKYSKKTINLFPETFIGRINNNTEITSKTEKYHQWCTDMNRPIYDKYIEDKGLKPIKGNIAFSIYDYFVPTKYTLNYFYHVYILIKIYRLGKRVRNILSKLYHFLIAK